MKLEQNETELIGRWKVINGKAVSDSTCQRIETLVSQELKEIGTDESGWDILYQDNNDGRFWELTYPKSEMHGGGPPKLTCLSANDARVKYNIDS